MIKEKVILQDSSGTNSDLDVTGKCTKFVFSTGANLVNNPTQPTFAIGTGSCVLFDDDGSLDEAEVRKYDRVQISHDDYKNAQNQNIPAERGVIREVQSRLDYPFTIHTLTLTSLNNAKVNTSIEWVNSDTTGDVYINSLANSTLGIKSLMETTSTHLGQNTTGVFPLYRMCSQTRELNWLAWMRLFQWLADCIIIETPWYHTLRAYCPAVDTRSAEFTFRSGTHDILREMRIVNQYRWRRDFQNIEFIRDNVSPRVETDVKFSNPSSINFKGTNSVLGHIPLTYPAYPIGFDWYHINTSQSLFTAKINRYATKVPLVVEVSFPLSQPSASATRNVHQVDTGEMIELDFRERADNIALRGKFVVLNRRIMFERNKVGVVTLQCLLHGDKLTPKTGLAYLTIKGDRITWDGDRLQIPAAS